MLAVAYRGADLQQQLRRLTEERAAAAAAGDAAAAEFARRWLQSQAQPPGWADRPMESVVSPLRRTPPHQPG